MAGLVAAALPATASAAPGDFASAGDFAINGGAFDLVTGDFDDDGTVDVATVDANGPTVDVLLGDGDGTFTRAPESPITVGDSPRGLAAGDLDGDGADDLVVAENGSDTLRRLLSDGDGSFTSAGTTATGADPVKVTLGLFDGDAVLDAAVSNSSSESATGSVSIFLGDGTGGFGAAPGSPVAVGQFPNNLVAASLNDDANQDLAVLNNGGDSVSILLGSGTGAFATAPGSPEAVGDGPTGIVAGTLNADAATDLAVANNFSENTTIVLGSATGDFTSPPSSPETLGDSDVTAADFDLDGDLDLAVLEGTSTLQVLAGNGTGDFTASDTAPVLGIAVQVAHADTDGDGDIDLLTGGGNGGEHAVTSLLNNETDADADGFLDVADECPNVAGNTRGCPFSGRLVTLKYKHRAEAFKGKVTSEEPSCIGPGVKVNVRKSLSSGGYDLIGSAETNAAGKYRIDEKVKRGRFTARIAQSTDPQTGICSESFSPVHQVRP